MRTVRQFFLGIIVLIVILGLSQLGQAGHQARAKPNVQSSAVVISDGTFNPVDWEVSVEATNEATHTVQQEMTGGNPGAFRKMTHILPHPGSGPDTTIEVTHIYLGETYDPSTQGAIDHLDYAEESKIIPPLPWEQAFSTPQVVLRQGGRTFRTYAIGLRFVANTTWEPGTLSNLTANSFFADDGSSDKPDFSSAGGPIEFGFSRFNIRTNTQPPIPANQDYVLEHGIDNWTVSVYTEQVNQPPVAIDDWFVVEAFSRKLLDVTQNDEDPEDEELLITQVTDPPFGEALILAWFIDYRHLGGITVDTFLYTVSDGELTDTAQVTVLIDCGCTAQCLSISSGAGQQPAAADVSPANDNIDLPLLYRIRDEVMKPTPHGRRYVDMYYETTPEILKILLIDSTALRDEAIATAELWQDNLHNLVDGDGTAIVTQAQVDAIKNFLTNLSAAASPELQQIIAAELLRLGPLDDYVGMTVKEAKSKAIGDPVVYLPIVFK